MAHVSCTFQKIGSVRNIRQGVSLFVDFCTSLNICTDEL